MNNNDIFKKLRVAHQLRNDQIIEILKLVDFRITQTELGAFFRSEDHKNFRPCGDQVLRNFLNGLIIHLRGPQETKKPAEPKKRPAAEAPPRKSTSDRQAEEDRKPEVPRKPFKREVPASNAEETPSHFDQPRRPRNNRPNPRYKGDE